MVNMKEIAEQAGVSRTAVSFVLSGRYKKDIRLSREVVERVLNVADNLGYIRNELACSIQKGRSGVVALMTTFFDFTIAIVQSYAQAADEAGYTLKLVPVDKKTDINAVLKRLVGQRVDGITAIELSEELKKQIGPWFWKHNIPQEGLDMATGSMSFNQIRSAELAAEYLVKAGHRKIICVSLSGRISMERSTGYQNVMERNGLPAEVILNSPDCLDMLLKENPDAVFAVNDGIALSLMQKLFSRKMFVPETFSLIGFGDVPAAAYTFPPLTTIHEPYDRTGIRSFESLHYRILHGSPMPEPPEPLVGKVIVRGTVAEKHGSPVPLL